MPVIRIAGILTVTLSLVSLRAAPGPTGELVVPAADGSGEAALSLTPAGVPLLSWVEPDGAGHALRFSTLEQGRWTAPRTAARGIDWFVNWADRPSVVPLAQGALLAHWLVKARARTGGYGYGIRFAHSRDGGDTWRSVHDAGMDTAADYSGFVSILAGERGGASAVYLAPSAVTRSAPSLRQEGHGEQEHAMSLRLVDFVADGTPSSDTVLDPGTCSCCTTALVRTARGPLVAYRDRAAGEVRDISVVRHVRGAWTAPAPVHRDGWVIPACPTNGPALDANGERVAVAWFTAAGDTPRLHVAFSPDSGATFSAPVRIDGGNPVGWPSIALLDDGAAAVVWLEAVGEGKGEIRLRRVSERTTPGATHLVARAAPGRSTGILQMVRTPAGLLVAWRDGRVRTVLVAEPRP